MPVPAGTLAADSKAHRASAPWSAEGTDALGQPEQGEV